MGKQQTGKASPSKPSPFPANWARMTHEQRRAWQAQHRPAPPAAPPAAPVAAAPAPAAPVAAAPAPAAQPIPQRPYDPPPIDPCAPAPDTILVTVQFPGEDVREMTGREFLRRLLCGITDAMSGE